MSTEASPQALRLDYFDGRSARAQAAEIRIDRERGELLVQAVELRRYALRQVRWPERQRHGQRQALLPDGGVLSAPDAAAWDAWALACGLRDSTTVRWMQSWRLVLLSMLLLAALLAAGWRWGVPAAASRAVALLPPEAEAAVGEQALVYLDEHLLKPSKLPDARRDQIAQRLEAALQRARAATGPQPTYRLLLRDGGKALGPNAFALPGGTIVLTDALAELLADQPDALTGVLAHELGHVQHRHGLRMALQGSATAAVAGLVVGDFSTVLAGVPVLLAQSSYSRGFEREADAYARQTLRGAGLDAGAMAVFFERIERRRHEKGGGFELPIAISSHPADAERVRFFSDKSR